MATIAADSRVPRRASVVAGIALGLCAPAAVTQEPSARSAQEITAERCRAQEHRQFDFWLGRWEVRNASGELVGHNEIERVAGGCALQENWRGLEGGRGVSINTYDPGLGRWTQRWVGFGATLWLEGGLEAGAMVLTGTSLRATPRGDVLDRIRWTPLPDGRVEQVWDISPDGGETWVRSFVGLYTRSATRPDTVP